MAKSILSISLVTVLYIITLLVSVSPSYAVTWPNFPACSNPQGTVVASYDSGTHGVPGDTSEYTGKDTVYTLGSGNALQCLCADNGAGIQTNWWKASALTSEEIAILTKEGWIVIADGSAWGLDQGTYLAKNSSFSCNGTGGSPYGDGRSDGKSTGGSTSSQGQVLGVSTGSVLGLANTGNVSFILSVFIAGIFLLALSFVTSHKSK